MTGDELSAAIYERQGFLIWASENRKKIGEIEREKIDGDRKGGWSTIPMRYVGEANRAEYMRQLKIIREIHDPEVAGPPKWANYFYRMEAAD